ncbi:MAG TPA: FixH family protein [Gemmatimonadaceae bacterium]|nr:FixH family protein [Gemmatimonadaceae bacterium]
MKRGLGWPIAVTLILAITVGVNIWVAVIADDDPSFAIEPNYYAKAIAWDSTMAQARENARLGWRLVPQLGAFTRDTGAPLHVSLLDSTGAPIHGAVVKVYALYNARAATIYEATLAPRDSAYEARIPVEHIGEWELRFEVTHGGQRFTSTSRVEAVAAGLKT